MFLNSIEKYNDSRHKCLDEYGIKAKDGGLRCGEIKFNSLSHIKSMASLQLINLVDKRHLQIAGTS